MSEFYPNTELFGLYALIQTGYYPEPHIYKIVGVLSSNAYTDVPVRWPIEKTRHENIVPIANVIHCGVDESDVIRVALKDITEILEGGSPADWKNWKKYEPVLPCRIGDWAYGIRNFRGRRIPKGGRVNRMYFLPGDNGGKMRLMIAIKGVCCGEWGKTIFGTLAEAEEVLAAEERDDG